MTPTDPYGVQALGRAVADFRSRLRSAVADAAPSAVEIMSSAVDPQTRYWQLMPESLGGAPTLRPCPHLDCGDLEEDDCVETIVCPCGEEHAVVATAYGRRAECENLGVRWTSTTRDVVELEHSRTKMRCWMAEPYDMMGTRSTR